MPNNIIDKIRVSGTDYTLSATSSGVSVVEVTQAEYDALPSSAKTDTSKMYVITDAEAGDLTNYYTKTETNTLLGGKQDTLVSSTNIKTINNESILGSGNIDIQGGGGGGKAIEAGRGITITTGETADTVSFNLPISAGTGTNSLVIASDAYDLSNRATKIGAVALNGADFHPTYATGSNSLAEGADTKAAGWASHAEGYITSATSTASHAEGTFTVASGESSHAEGYYSKAFGDYSHTEGYQTKALNRSEHSCGQNNISSSASTTFGDSGNTLFSVGNGTANNARHNAFEIRQNGDIYLSSGGTDIKLQDHLGGGGGGGKAIEAGRGISVTTGATADTISVSLPISAGTGTNSIEENYATSANGNYSHSEGYWTRANGLHSHAEGFNTTASGESAHAEGSGTQANGISSHAEGASTNASGYRSHAEGYHTIANNMSEHASGQYNVSSSASTTFGDGGNTLFSVGNGTANNARHNAFEIRQNGDIYLNDGTKLQDTITATASNTTALGGLSLVKLSQAEYDALVTKDSNTLYVIVN